MAFRRQRRRPVPYPVGLHPRRDIRESARPVDAHDIAQRIVDRRSRDSFGYPSNHNDERASRLLASFPSAIRSDGVVAAVSRSVARPGLPRIGTLLPCHHRRIRPDGPFVPGSGSRDSPAHVRCSDSGIPGDHVHRSRRYADRTRAAMQPVALCRVDCTGRFRDTWIDRDALWPCPSHRPEFACGRGGRKHRRTSLGSYPPPAPDKDLRLKNRPADYPFDPADTMCSDASRPSFLLRLKLSKLRKLIGLSWLLLGDLTR